MRRPEPRVKVWRWTEPGTRGRTGRRDDHREAKAAAVQAATGLQLDGFELHDAWMKLFDLGWRIRWEDA